ncbi:PC-esterase domain-containing protein 1A-like [Synchiropus picturatus]
MERREQREEVRKATLKVMDAIEEAVVMMAVRHEVLHNGTSYREVRQFQSPHHLVRFYFVTRVYSSYMRSILEEFRRGTKPDLVIINSCLWDISRYGGDWVSQYKRDLSQFFEHIDRVLPDEALVVWTQTMPLAEQIRGGFLVPEISHRAPAISHDVIEANFYSATLADAYDMDVLDLHFLFRFSLRHRAKDGIHWNAIVHRRISSMLMLHVAQAWGVSLSDPVIPPPAFGSHHQVQPPAGGLTGESITNFSAPATRRPPAMTPPQHQRRFHYPMADYRQDTDRTRGLTTTTHTVTKHHLEAATTRFKVDFFTEFLRDRGKLITKKELI